MFYTKPWADVLIVLLVVVLFVGPKRLPSLGRALGQGFREFKDGITGGSKDEDSDPRALPAAEEAPRPATVGAERDSAEVGTSEHRG